MAYWSSLSTKYWASSGLHVTWGLICTSRVKCNVTCHCCSSATFPSCSLFWTISSRQPSAFGNWNVRRKCPAIMYGGKFHVRREYPSLRDPSASTFYHIPFMAYRPNYNFMEEGATPNILPPPPPPPPPLLPLPSQLAAESLRTREGLSKAVCRCP